MLQKWCTGSTPVGMMSLLGEAEAKQQSPTEQPLRGSSHASLKGLQVQRATVRRSSRMRTGELVPQLDLAQESKYISRRFCSQVG